MTKTTRGLLLGALMAGLLLAGGLGTAPALQKDKKDAKDAKVGTVEVYKDKAGEYRFRVTDADGKVIAMPPRGHDTKEECLKAIDLVRETLNKAKVTEVKEAKDDKKKE